jgi:hypothetical protein
LDVPTVPALLMRTSISTAASTRIAGCAPAPTAGTSGPASSYSRQAAAMTKVTIKNANFLEATIFLPFEEEQQASLQPA